MGDDIVALAKRHSKKHKLGSGKGEHLTLWSVRKALDNVKNNSGLSWLYMASTSSELSNGIQMVSELAKTMMAQQCATADVHLSANRLLPKYMASVDGLKDLCDLPMSLL